MKYRVFSALISIMLILCLSSCQTTQSNYANAATPTESQKIISQKPTNITPIVFQSDLMGIWTGPKSPNLEHTEYFISYLYFSSQGVYYMYSKDGFPSKNDFTSKYLIASSYSISVNSEGDTICKFGDWTATISSKSSMRVSGRTISGTYRK